MNNINISDKEFLQLKDIIYKKSGIHITDDDIKNLKNKLIDRLLINSLDSFRDYYQFLITDVTIIRKFPILQSATKILI